MIRIIVRTVGVIPVGDCPSSVGMSTFLVNAPELEKFLLERNDYGNREVIGADAWNKDVQKFQKKGVWIKPTI